MLDTCYITTVASCYGADTRKGTTMATNSLGKYQIKVTCTVEDVCVIAVYTDHYADMVIDNVAVFVSELNTAKRTNNVEWLETRINNAFMDRAEARAQRY